MDLLGPATILIADDSAPTRRLLRRVFETEGTTVIEAEDGHEVLRHATSRAFDLVLLDLEMPLLNGMDTLRQLRLQDPDLPVLLVSGMVTVPISVQATRLGAYDVIPKPIDLGHLLRVASEAIAHHRGASAAPGGQEQDACRHIIGDGVVMRRIKQQLRRVARYDVPVLVTGESGSGKELIARALHEASTRASRPFVAFNAAAVPDTLFESTLFGHTRGSFTGADRTAPGLMVAADGGTLVLDEIGDLSPANQVKLLRALETQQVLAVGATKPIDVNVRVIACTNADLGAKVKDGSYRADLYYRLRGVTIEVPPLRQRREDISDIALKLLHEARDRYGLEVSGFAPVVTELLMEYPWPGNVRELKHVVTAAALLANTAWISPSDLPAEIAGTSKAVTADAHEDMSLDAAERRHVRRVLETTDNRSDAARRLGLSRSAFYRLLGKHGLT